MKRPRQRPNSMHGPPRRPPSPWIPPTPGQEPVEGKIYLISDKTTELSDRVRQHNEQHADDHHQRMVIWTADCFYILPPGQEKPRLNRAPRGLSWIFTLRCSRPSAETRAFIRQMELDYPRPEGTPVEVIY